MQNAISSESFDTSGVLASAKRAIRAVPPLWPLESSVAVNPFLGHTNQSLAAAAVQLRRAGGISVTMPRSWYRQQIRNGVIEDQDLVAALNASVEKSVSLTLDSIKAALASPNQKLGAVSTVAELVNQVSGIDWAGLISERFGQWASSYFDQGQALWAAPKAEGPFSAWRLYATRDLTPEIFGLRDFASHVNCTPNSAPIALARAMKTLGVSTNAMEAYFHRLLLTINGWAQLGRQRLWTAELSNKEDSTLIELLAIRVVWEEALMINHGAEIRSAWQKALEAFAQATVPTDDDCLDEVLQESAERAAQRRLQLSWNTYSANKREQRAELQMAFCIDVRSEIIRRALESIDPTIETLGFAGFFGLGIRHKRFASDVAESRLPVLLTPTIETSSGSPSARDANAANSVRIRARAARALGRFRLAAVSSFAFVESAGLLYALKLVRNGLRLTKDQSLNEPAPRFHPSLDHSFRLEIAFSVLSAMSLTKNFARLVILTGHGANVINNPHASALHCGACGGYSGEVNARLLASLLNEEEIRKGLEAKGIMIPRDTLFMGALHDTTTDKITLFDSDFSSAEHQEEISKAKSWIGAASAVARTQRAPGLPRANKPDHIFRRAHDWSEIRPEWGLAGCYAFIVAPRERTRNLDLAGKAFLHNYNWKQDEQYKVLELILTAPVVVASWISLQYYGSVVAPQIFGSGNKLLHNVTGGIGVIEGNGGDLRPGLPWQSVHDGRKLAHEPLRLSVLIEAPQEAITEILKRHTQVRHLFDNKWMHLLSIDETGRIAGRYGRNLNWESVQEAKLGPVGY